MAETKATSEGTPSVKQLVLRVTPKEASKLIAQRLRVGDRIAGQIGPKSSGPQLYGTVSDLHKWDKYNSTLLRTIFTTPSFADNYEACELSFVPQMEEALPEYRRELVRRFLGKRTELQSIKAQLVLFDKAPQPISDKRGAVKSFGNKVFIVHGHDKVAKQTVARFLERLHLDVVILHEKADKGRTIIEKLLEESEADVGYAVVLLTPDDVGKLAVQEGEPSPRARQNVILELGLFMAKLGRQRVHALYGDGVELPSDYHGVLYTQFDDSGAWKLKLATELKAIGFDIDLNRLA